MQPLLARRIAGLQFARVTLKPLLSRIIRGASRCVTANRFAAEPISRRLCIEQKSNHGQILAATKHGVLVPFFLLGEDLTPPPPQPRPQSWHRIASPSFLVSPWGGKLGSPSFASSIEMAVCSCVRRTRGKRHSNTIANMGKKGDEENFTMFQPKGSSRCWVAVIDRIRLVTLKKVSGRMRAYGIPQANILPFLPCCPRGEAERVPSTLRQAMTKVPALLHLDNDGNRGEANLLQVLAHSPPWRRNTLHRKKTRSLRGQNKKSQPRLEG